MRRENSACATLARSPRAMARSFLLLLLLSTGGGGPPGGFFFGGDRSGSPPWRTMTAEACTVFLAGKNATAAGHSTFVSHSNDGEFDTDPRLVKIPASGPHPPGTLRPIFFGPESYPRYVGSDRGDIPEYQPRGEGQEPFEPIGHIPQVRRTYAYLEQTYGAVNEKSVGIGESTCSGIFGSLPVGHPKGTALLSVDELTRIAMERSSSAREAIRIMGELAETYGFYGAGAFEGTAESLGVVDPEEAWIFHVLPDPTGKSAIWAAQRVLDDSFAAIANMFVIREIDPTDKKNFMMSDSVHAVAKKYNWWKESDGLLDFTKIYSDGEYSHKYYSGRRVWGAYHLASPSLNLPPEYDELLRDAAYPVYVKPDAPLAPRDLFKFHRYRYQGTLYDQEKPTDPRMAVAGGPFGSPDRWTGGRAERSLAGQGNWERPIGLHRTSDSYVVQCSDSDDPSSDDDGGLGAVLWFGPGSALGTVYAPFLVRTADVPSSYRSGHQAKFSRDSAFWAAVFAHNVANLRWNLAVKDLESRQHELERDSVDMVASAAARFARDKDFAKVEEAYLSNAAKVVSSLWSLSDELMAKYASGFVNVPPDDMSQSPGYPAWWLEKAGYGLGPPPPPAKPRCCRPSPAAAEGTASTDGGGTSDGNGGGGPPATAAAWGNDAEEGPTGKEAMKQYLASLKATAAVA